VRVVLALILAVPEHALIVALAVCALAFQAHQAGLAVPRLGARATDEFLMQHGINLLTQCLQP
jgi:hypothetical protein